MGSPEQLSPYPYEQEPGLVLIKAGSKPEAVKIIEFPREQEEKEEEPYGHIVREALEIEETYNEKLKRRYYSFSGEKTGNEQKNLAERKKIARDIISILPPEELQPEKKIVTNENAKDFIVSVLNSQDNVYAKNQAIREWINDGGQDSFLMAEEIIASEINKKEKVDVQAIALLGEVWQTKEALIHPSNELMGVLENSQDNLFDCLVILNKIDDPVINVAFHKIIDFMGAYLVGCQNGDRRYRDGDTNFFRMIRLLREEKEKAKNYLMSGHLNDIDDTFYSDDREKEGKISGMPGGASDKNIYTFKNLTQSYENRINLGINEGFTIFNPVIKIATGYFAMYANGKVARIFSEKSENGQRRKREEDFIASNSPEDEYIYEEINERVIPDYQCPDARARRQHRLLRLERHRAAHVHVSGEWKFAA